MTDEQERHTVTSASRQAEQVLSSLSDQLAFLMERYNSLQWIAVPDCDKEALFANDEGQREVRDELMAVYNR